MDRYLHVGSKQVRLLDFVLSNVVPFVICTFFSLRCLLIAVLTFFSYLNSVVLDIMVPSRVLRIPDSCLGQRKAVELATR